MNLFKKNINLLSMCVLLLAFIGAFLLSSLSLASADATKVKEDEIKIAHITDSHYFAYEDCYLGSQDDEDYKNTVFYKSLSKDTKLIKQSGSLLSATISNLLVEQPDYLIVSGDITSNGEIKGHMDVANALRYLQEEMRKIQGKENFQVFVIPGNHDLYNNRASKYINEAEATDTMPKGSSYSSSNYITTALAFKTIYNGLGYPRISPADLAHTNTGAYMLEYFNEQATHEFAFTTQYIDSAMASNVSCTYYYDTYGFPTETDRVVGCLSYIADITNKNYSFVMVDATERDARSATYNMNISESIYWNQATGGRVTEQMKSWFKTNTSAIKNAKKTIIGSTHFNLLPHYTMEENYTKDFTLYNWEDTAQFFADEIGARYFYTGHMHSSDRAQFVSYGGNVIQDFETGSLVSLHSPTRYAKIVRYKEGQNIFEDLYDSVSTINSLKGVKSLKINTSEQSEELMLFNNIDDLEEAIGAEIYDKLVERLLDGFVNASLEATLVGLLNGLDLSSIPLVGGYSSAINQLARTLINQIFYDLDYNIDGIEAENLFEFVEGAVYKSDTLNMIIYQEGDEIYTLEKIFLNAYKAHLMGNEPEMFDSSTTFGKACIKTVEGLEDGSIVDKLLNGLLDPLLYADNSIVRQLYEYEFNVTSCTDPKFNDLVGLFISKVSEKHPLNNGGTLRVCDVLNMNKNGSLYNALMGLVPADIGEIINSIIDNGLPSWCEDMLDKYLTEAFFTGIGGLLSETYQSFSLDKIADGPSYIFDGDAIKDEEWNHILYGIDNYSKNYTYIGRALSLDENPPTYEDGRLPALLTSTFGDDAATSQNFKWYTNHEIGGKLVYREKGQSEYIVAATHTEIIPVAVPLIDLGIFATTTETSYENAQGDEVLFDYNNLAQRDMAGLHSSVKFKAVHSVSLTNLKANTEYEYKVMGTFNDQEFVISETPYTFKTALEKSDKAPFTFMAISDIQGTIEPSYKLALDALTAAKEKIDYDFIINCGDVVDNGKNFKQWGFALNGLAPIFANTSTVVAAGNHEKSAKALASYYNFGGIGNKDKQDLTSGVYYSFDYGATHFIVLNTNDLTKDGLSKAQLTWLKSELAKANEENKTIIVAMHKSLYSIGSHVEDSDIIALRAQLVPLFAENGVDLVLAGHDHTYSTTQVINRDGAVVSKVKKTKNGFKLSGDEGVVYMTLGTLADKYYEYRKVEETEQLLNKKYTIFDQIDAPMFTSVTISDDGIEVEGYAYKDGNVMTLSQYKAYVEKTTNWPVLITLFVAAIALVVAAYFVAINKNYTKPQKNID